MKRLLVVGFVGMALGSPTVAAASSARLVHGPLVLRLTGQSQAERRDPTVDWSTHRYAVVFKLDRDPLGPYQPDPDVRTVETRGRFALEGYPLDDSLARLYAKGAGPRGSTFCFVGLVKEPSSSTFVRGLDRRKLGSKIKVRLQPRANRRSLSRPLVIRATLRSAEVTLGGSAARRLLSRIGC